MSINGAMLAGVSGLSANAAALSTISQNIANVNTVGYKRSSTDFATMVNSQQGGMSYSAGGVQASARHFISQTGLLQRTTSNTDLAISGQGFFVVTQKPEELAPTDTRLFTRAGSFVVDDLGYLQNSSGYYLQGWPVGPDGTISTDPSNMNLLKTINVGNVGGAAEPTTRVGLNANLKSTQELHDDIANYDAAVPTMTMASYLQTNLTSANPPAGTTVAVQGFKPDFEISIPISDSKGSQRSLTLALLKSETANEWHAELIAPPLVDSEGKVKYDAAGNVEYDIVGVTNGLLGSGTIKFTSDGRLDVAGSDFLSNVLDGLEIAASDSTPVAGTPRWSDSVGASQQPITFDLAAATGGLTQYDSTSVVQATYTNGTTFGNLTEVKIDDTGYVTAIFDNGVMRQIAQVALATFPSADNLTEVSGNAYRVSQYSGTYNLKAPGTGGSGLLASSQLESSTVDLSTEFTGLITTQRAYSASSKIITTADEMLAELLNIKR